MSGPVYADPTQSYNVPGNVYYRPDLPTDYFIISVKDRVGTTPVEAGYSFDVDPDGTPVLVFKNGIDGITIETDSDGYPALTVADTSQYASIQTDSDRVPVFVGVK